MTAISLDKFARAKTSTYDKRAVLEKRRNLEAGKVNKYRKVKERLGDTIERPDGFDPDEYARRLEAQRATLPAETNADILAMAKRRKGKGGLVLPESRREPTPDAVLDGAETTAGQGEGGGRHALRCIGACVARHRWFHVWLMDASFGCRRPPPPLR